MALAMMCQALGLHFTYVGTGYLFAYDREHPIGGKGFDDDGILNESILVSNCCDNKMGVTDVCFVNEKAGINYK